MNSRSKQMNIRVCLAFVLTSCIILQVQTDECDDLYKCANNVKYGSNGTWSFLKLKSKPATQSEWTTIYNNICNTKSTRLECLDLSSCTNTTVTKKAQIAQKDTNVVCSTNGLNFLRRLYTEEPQCLGNVTMFNMSVARRTYCKTTYLDNITDTMSLSDKCDLVKQERFCLRDYMAEHCGDLHKWIIDQSFKSVTEVYYQDCTYMTYSLFASWSSDREASAISTISLVSSYGTTFPFPAES